MAIVVDENVMMKDEEEDRGDDERLRKKNYVWLMRNQGEEGSEVGEGWRGRGIGYDD